MATWTVLVMVSEQIEIEADTEDQATQLAVSMFDPTAHDPDVVEVWRSDRD